ncbi:hypothetical protein JCGZ_09258 [Jatropha curcas]|uniref:F-box domain-containing protein n=1 Tax=Jatropha curcas TaxID=180498 RepID=A0A067KRQ5_JATCU|nr:hypothetical protein JCGZ_09258 [Jatropha curcas]
MDSLLQPSSPPQQPYRDWVELPRDVTAMILSRLDTEEILNTARLVCSTWHSVCNDPSMWRSIDMRGFDGYCEELDYDIEKMCKYAVDRSCGGLIDINIEYFATDDLLSYIADREAVRKFPLLEELAILSCSSEKALEVVGHCCPLLRSLKVNDRAHKDFHTECNLEALIIAENFPHLHHLQILGNRLTNEGLQAILNGCPHLESLDLRKCFNIRTVGDLGKRCAEQIKDLRWPYDPTPISDDYPFSESSDEEDYDASIFSSLSWSDGPYGGDHYDFYDDFDDYEDYFDSRYDY